MSDQGDSWFSNLLLDGPDRVQSRRIRELRSEADDTASSVIINVRKMEALAARTDRLELLCESLVELALTRELVTREELGVLIAQVDLRDGVEDGGLRSGESRSQAPLCSACERPINPKRTACVYCGAKIDTATRMAAPKKPVRMVSCGGCGQEVDQRESNFTASGLRCDRCYRPE